MMAGAEYLTPDVLRALWQEIAAALATSLAAAKTDLQSFLKSLNPAWNLVGRVHFNLAENRRDDDAPFAFLATYTTQLSAQARAQHVPLGQALREYAGAANRDKTAVAAAAGAARRRDLRLAAPDGRRGRALPPAALDAGRGRAPARQRARPGTRRRRRAHAAVVARQPPAAPAGDRHRRRAQALGARPGGRARLPHGGHAGRRDAEPRRRSPRCSSGTDSLVLLRGQWVEVDRERLERSIQQFREAEELAERDGLTFVAAMRMLAGAAVADERRRCRGRRLVARDRRPVAGGDAAKAALARRRGRRSGSGAARHAAAVSARRRAVAATAVGARLGACLADDMGLGKTIQVLALLLAERRGPSLLVAPASLLANWAAEVEKFAPDLKVAIVHPSAMTRGADRRVHRRARGGSTWRSPAMARCCASRRWRRSNGATRSSTRRRRSRTRTRSRRARPRR